MAGNELTPFVLKDVKGLNSGEQKGSGSYGAVYGVTVKGVTCIAKRLHDILVNSQVSRQEKISIQQKFAAECALLSKLRHPNVVHFVGVYYGRGANDLSLVMECLHTDLAKFLESCSSKIPLSIKLSILLDVSYGLLYFHTHTPPIIHRDLSANNVLLTTDLRAKIADLGVAKLLDHQTQVAIAHTKAPGSLGYMPPEALQENPVYNYKLDIFSFGHLALYVAGEKFPDVHELDERTMLAALNKSKVQIQKRRKAIECIGGERHTLYLLITKCLQDKLEHRPTTTELNGSLKELCTKYPHSVAEVSKLVPQAEKEEAQALKMAKLREHVESLKKENFELMGDLEAQRVQAAIWKQDFDSERHEREQAAGRRDEEVARDRIYIEQLKDELKRLQLQSKLKLSDASYKERFDESDLQTAIAQSKEEETAWQLAELRKERDALRTEVEQLKSGKMNERRFSAAFQKEFEKREEFQAKYHQVLDRCSELFERAQQLRGVLEQHNIPIPDPPPKQRAPPVDIPRAIIPELFERAQQLRGVLEQHNIPIPDPPPKQRAPPVDIPRAIIPQRPLVVRSDDDARLHVHSQVNQGDPAHYHASPPTARATPLASNIPPGVDPHSHPQQQYEFRQPPAPIVPLPQHGGGQIYQPHEAAEMYVQPQHFSHHPYVEGERGHVRGQPMYHAPIQDPHQPISYREPVYDENMPREHEAVMKDHPMRVQMQREHEALMAQQREREQQEQNRRFHQEQQKHNALVRQGYSVDDPQYGPHKRQTPHPSLTAKSITSPHFLVEPRQHPSPPVSPGIRHVSGLQYHIGSDHMYGPPHPREADPHAIIEHQHQLEQMRLQDEQAQAQMQVQQHNMLHIQDHQQMLYAQHQHNQPQQPTPRLYGDRPLPQSQPRYPLADHNVHPHDQFMQPAHNILSHDQLMQPAQPPPLHLSPSSNQAQIAAQHPADMQPEVAGNNQPQDHYSQVEPISPIEEEIFDYPQMDAISLEESSDVVSAQVSKSMKETHPDLPEQCPEQNSKQQDENRLMKGLNTEIHETAAGVEANVQSEEELTSLEGAPMDPNLVCPMCARGYRVGEIQKYRRHVKSCRGSK